MLKRLYEWFHARDIESVLRSMHHDVIRANGMEGGYVYGRDEVRSDWSRQWAMIDPGGHRFRRPLRTGDASGHSRAPDQIRDAPLTVGVYSPYPAETAHELPE
jgi:hypothetical protein